MKKIIFNAFILSAMLAFTSCDSNNKKDSTEVAEDKNEKEFNENMDYDTEFAVSAASGGLLEVKLGELAQTNAASDLVKKFGKDMVADHTVANLELKAIALAKNIALPEAMSDKHQSDYNNLMEKKGVDFDKAYGDFMVSDHKDDIDDFKAEAEKGNSADIKKWAAEKVPTLEHHLQMAKEMCDVVKK